jgi:hypothetical protein
MIKHEIVYTPWCQELDPKYSPKIKQSLKDIDIDMAPEFNPFGF